MSIQPISAHKVTAQKSVNTRRNSTRRSYVLLCGVSSESLGRCVEEKAQQGRLAVSARQISQLYCRSPGRVLEWILEFIPVSLTWHCLPRDEMANTWITVAKDFMHQNEEMFWSSTKLKLCSLGEPKIANVSAAFVAHETHLSCTRVQLITELWPSGNNPNTKPFAVMCVRYAKDPKQVRSFQKLVLLSSCCHCLFWTSLNHCLNLHAFYRVSFTWCKTKIQQSDRVSTAADLVPVAH